MTLTRYRQIKQHIHDKAVACGRSPDDIALIAVAKTYPIDAIASAYQEGCRDFGENRVQEALKKIPLLPADCRWHLIGTLQSNKITAALPLFQCIHAVDNPLLAEKISRASVTRGCVTSVLLQVNTSGEASKHGLSGEAWEAALAHVNQLPALRIEGLMTLAPYTQNEEVIRLCFRRLYAWREAWRGRMQDPAAFRHLSMGMSHDYEIAIEEGATILRIGSAIFSS